MPGKVSCSYEAIVASAYHNCLVLAPAKVKMVMMILMMLLMMLMMLMTVMITLVGRSSKLVSPPVKSFSVRAAH